MTNLHPHLLQPLSIDTNITYDLDMSKFPGLDDPQHMYQPALLIATDWSDYVYHDAQCATHDADINRVPNILDDHGYLQDSNQNLFSDLDPSSALDSNTFQFILEDVVEELSFSYDNTFSQSTRLNTDISPRRDVGNCDLDCYLDTVYGISADEVPAVASRGRGQKRLRSAVEDADTRKKSKLTDDSSVLPSIVPVCSTYGHCDLSRLS